ncbi:hypothetical protein AYL99_11680 [Fonsecaea erecta]|uniref:Uncharacterized protein n=1 Tax=Fonsecaea erecta TaxID=1367422 RepID=A0A178Z4Z0_9EURO|nr:hypothetical protein AYL99_11680 [Fonsecaea erecta]OAP54145.1 hypothetical protein AYL99_11680 [Fonsecaea erecta]
MDGFLNALHEDTPNQGPNLGDIRTQIFANSETLPSPGLLLGPNDSIENWATLDHRMEAAFRQLLVTHEATHLRVPPVQSTAGITPVGSPSVHTPGTSVPAGQTLRVPSTFLGPAQAHLS